MAIWHIGNYLARNREVVDAIQSLGCNLQLNLNSVTLDPELSLSASTSRQLADLEIQLVFARSPCSRVRQLWFCATLSGSGASVC